MPSVVFVEKQVRELGADRFINIPFFVKSGDVIGSSTLPWKPSKIELLQLSRPDLMKMVPFTVEKKKKATKEELAVILMENWSEVVQCASSSSSDQKGGGYDDDKEKDTDKDKDEDKNEDDEPSLPLPEAEDDAFVITVQKTWDNEFRNFVVSGFFTIAMLKAMIAGVWNIAVRAQRIVLRGADCADHLTFDDLGVFDAVIFQLFIQGVGGAGVKRRAITIADMKPLENDHAGIKAIFALSSFNSRPWLQSMEKDMVRDYLAELENRKSVPQQVSSTVERIVEYKTVKDGKATTQLQRTTLF